MKYLSYDGLGYFWQKLKALFDKKVDKADGKQLSTEDFTTALKNKLDGIAEGANKTVVDESLSESSANPVQNKAVYSALAGKAAATHQHQISDVQNLQTTLDGKAAATHSHEISGVTGLQSALDAKLASAMRGQANGVASLGEDGKVPSSQLPSYVDDVIEGYLYQDKFYSDPQHQSQITGESGKIYVNLESDANDAYRWSGSVFVKISGCGCDSDHQ